MSDACVAEAAGGTPGRRLARVAASQHGVFGRAQAVACGVHPRTIDRRLSSGTWDRLYPGVYRMAGSPVTWKQALCAACLAWGDGAVVSHRAAAALWEMPGFRPGRVELTVPRRPRRAYNHRVHMSAHLAAADVTKVEGVPVTTPARTLIDIAGAVRAEVLEEALDDALRRRLLTPSRLRRRLGQAGGRGRRGCATLAALLDARAGGSGVPQSVFETRMLRALRRAGLPMPAVQHEVQTRAGLAVLDFAYVDRRVAIETDGFRWHSSRLRWDHDRDRRNALTLLGWTVIHVTWPRLRDRPDDVAGVIRSALARP